ncbi:MAG TPA: NAD(P)/FAD-dependent oxidoreductase [Propionibacterium sp.]|nr:NAD(P)/FAD-dependent oxidoreductase [Propionibacterium sp.]
MSVHTKAEPSRENLERVLQDAELPPLLAALASLTGDASLVDPELRPAMTADDLLVPAQGGMSPEAIELGRQRALAALEEFFVDGEKGAPSVERLRRSAAFLVGEDQVDVYLPMLEYEFQLDPTADASKPPTRQTGLRATVVGGGMSGIAAALRLRAAGHDVTILEKAADFGGVWRENNYPGCRLDTSNFAYSYSWHQKADWQEQYSSRDAVLQYFRDITEATGLAELTRFDTTLEKATWQDADNVWELVVADGAGRTETLRTSILVIARGQLNVPHQPAIPGLQDFGGVVTHTATWPDDLDVTGKSVAVVGTGASAFQVVPEVEPIVASLHVFQRSAPWMLPTPTYKEPLTEGMAWLFANVPDYHRWYRFYQYWTTQSRHKVAQVDPAWDRTGSVSELNHRLREVLGDHIRGQFLDREDLIPAVVPNYPPFAKRMLRDDGSWAAALKSPRTTLVTEPILEVTPTGIRTEGGLHEVDVIVLATGFQASDFLHGLSILGRGGVDLDDVWGGSPRAYLGVTVPDFPNLFWLYGPNTNLVVNGSLISMTEAEVTHVLNCVDHMLAHDADAIMCRPETLERFIAEIDEVNSSMAWGVPSVSSWYKNADGRVTQNWPLAVDEYFKRAKSPVADTYSVWAHDPDA